MAKNYKKHIDNDDLDQIFDFILRPLRSKSARKIYKVLYDEKETSNLTTLDIQIKLKKQGTILSKKEINNWLSDLLEARLVQKEEKRGKPTTISYNDKYTFDLWKLGEIGVQIGQNIPHFLPTQIYLNELETNPVKAVSEHTFTQLADVKDFLQQLIVENLYEAGGMVEINEFVDLIINIEKLGQNLSFNSLYQIKQKPRTLKEKVLAFLGITQEKNIVVLTEEGRRVYEEKMEVYPPS